MIARVFHRMVNPAVIAALAAMLAIFSLDSARAQPPGPVPATLAPIQLTPERRQLIGVKFATVERRDVSEHLETTGSIEPDEKLQSYVQTRFSGWIQKVFANQTWQSVRKGQPLFTIYSPDLVSTEHEYLLALKEQSRVQSSDIEDVADGANSLVESAAERLRQWNVAPSEIARLKRERTVGGAVAIDSPMTGVISDRAAQPNMYVQPETRLFTIIDLSRVWIYAAVFQDQIGKLRIGDPAIVTVDAYPGEKFEGRVDFIQPQIDPMTRTAKVRCEFVNRKGMLMPGMFARVAIHLPLGVQVVIPESGVIRTGLRNVAFVDRGDGYLTPTEVELGPRVGADQIVLKGLKPGDRIVGSANFLIDSESQLQAAAGAYVPPPPGIAANSESPVAAENQSAAKVEMTTDPSPPKRGSNKLRIALHDASGKPIANAKVSITFFMAAMPAMGMAAMRAQVAASDQGDGAYSVSLDLPSGGTWQVTIVATKEGRAIATNQFNVSVTGPMSM
ncbi:MAG: efflux RND transporter periplasmic adaptor subunit [Candidatus Binatus sp.]|uniref:FixH family protein n=1 Tax=Candidatus Binatus sp. TaxID=2811406 RepID=UPI002727C085|nr:FixH family protein [Candidatus Binatus sp.]MDO8433389.1 efflux RND transporter periplasmic adaptor subunit [Candidatus Binatus sp.]